MALSDNIEDLLYNKKELIYFNEINEDLPLWIYKFKFKERKGAIDELYVNGYTGTIMRWWQGEVEADENFRNRRGIE
jgi:hypothetical protein